MSKSASPSSSGSSNAEGVDLRDPFLAALMAWLIPGAGHWYQRRRSKAVLFFVCIVGTFGYGLWLGEGRVVYASWGPSPEEKRLPFLCQAGVGAAALPAMYQAKRFDKEVERNEALKRAADGKPEFWDTFMVPPRLDNARPGVGDELDRLSKTLNRRFELGTVYTMVAGLLNVLVIFDAFGGPAYGALRKKEDDKKEKEKEGKPADSAAPAKA